MERLPPDYYKNRIDCAAIKAPDGRIWTGKRHCHCIATIKQATGQRTGGDYEQGFVNCEGEFLTRGEAAKRALMTGQVKQLVAPPDLYSEDLY